ncbi:MAG: metallophosphoesterase [Bacteroidota bacterium]
MKRKYLLFCLSIAYLLISCDNTSVESSVVKDLSSLPDDLPFFVQPDSLNNPIKLKLIEAYKEYEEPSINLDTIAEKWGFSLGDPANGLIVTASQIPDTKEIVSLPHESDKSNWSFWYSKKLLITDPVYLQVNADDGAQVFQDGQQIVEVVMGTYFLLNPSADSSTIHIRVLNNAMEGGLRMAGFSKVATVNRHQSEKEVATQVKTFVKQALQLPVLDNQQAAIIIKAIEEPNRSNVNAASRLFVPVQVAPHLQRMNFSEYALVYEKSVRSNVAMNILNRTNGARNNFMCDAQEGNMCGVRSLIEPGFDYNIQLTESKLAVNYPLSLQTAQVNYSFSVWGDSQGGWNTFSKLSKRMAQQNDAFTIGLGDLVANGVERSEWVDFFTCLEPLSQKMPLYLIPGNHDYDGYYNYLYPSNYHDYTFHTDGTKTYFSWRSPYAAFIVLDPNSNFPLSIDKEQMAWFENEIQSDVWQSADWRFVLIHQPPYSQAWPGYQGDEFIKTLIDEKAESAEIDFVLSGHTHAYERLTKQYGEQKTTFLVLGGAGGTLEPAESSAEPKMDVVVKKHHFGRFNFSTKQIGFQAIGLDGEVLDEFSRSK